jgi:hypothetical protein
MLARGSFTPREISNNMPISTLQILELLRMSPEGLTSTEVSEKLSSVHNNAGGRLSKLAAYGEIEKMKDRSPSGKIKWRLKPSI